MKHLNANLDNLTNADAASAKSAGTEINALGVVSSNNGNDIAGDVVSIDGVSYSQGGTTTFEATCEAIAIDFTVGRTTHDELRLVAGDGLTYAIPAGTTLDIYNEATFTTLADTVTVATTAAVGATTIVLTGFITAGQGAGDFIQNCSVAVTTDNITSGDVCVNGNLIVSGDVLDKDGDPIITEGAIGGSGSNAALQIVPSSTTTTVTTCTGGTAFTANQGVAANSGDYAFFDAAGVELADNAMFTAGTQDTTASNIAWIGIKGAADAGANSNWTTLQLAILAAAGFPTTDPTFLNSNNSQFRVAETDSRLSAASPPAQTFTPFNLMVTQPDGGTFTVRVGWVRTDPGGVDDPILIGGTSASLAPAAGFGGDGSNPFGLGINALYPFYFQPNDFQLGPTGAYEDGATATAFNVSVTCTAGGTTTTTPTVTVDGNLAVPPSTKDSISCTNDVSALTYEAIPELLHSGGYVLSDVNIRVIGNTVNLATAVGASTNGISYITFNGDGGTFSAVQQGILDLTNVTYTTPTTRTGQVLTAANNDFTAFNISYSQDEVNATFSATIREMVVIDSGSFKTIYLGGTARDGTFGTPTGTFRGIGNIAGSDFTVAPQGLYRGIYSPAGSLLATEPTPRSATWVLGCTGPARVVGTTSGATTTTGGSSSTTTVSSTSGSQTTTTTVTSSGVSTSTGGTSTTVSPSGVTTTTVDGTTNAGAADDGGNVQTQTTVSSGGVTITDGDTASTSIASNLVMLTGPDGGTLTLDGDDGTTIVAPPVVGNTTNQTAVLNDAGISITGPTTTTNTTPPATTIVPTQVMVAGPVTATNTTAPSTTVAPTQVMVTGPVTATNTTPASTTVVPTQVTVMGPVTVAQPTPDSTTITPAAITTTGDVDLGGDIIISDTTATDIGPVTSTPSQTTMMSVGTNAAVPADGNITLGSAGYIGGPFFAELVHDANDGFLFAGSDGGILPNTNYGSLTLTIDGTAYTFNARWYLRTNNRLRANGVTVGSMLATDGTTTWQSLVAATEDRLTAGTDLTLSGVSNITTNLNVLSVGSGTLSLYDNGTQSSIVATKDLIIASGQNEDNSNTLTAPTSADIIITTGTSAAGTAAVGDVSISADDIIVTGTKITNPTTGQTTALGIDSSGALTTTVSSSGSGLDISDLSDNTIPIVDQAAATFGTAVTNTVAASVNSSLGLLRVIFNAADVTAMGLDTNTTLVQMVLTVSGFGTTVRTYNLAGTFSGTTYTITDQTTVDNGGANVTISDYLALYSGTIAIGAVTVAIGTLGANSFVDSVLTQVATSVEGTTSNTVTITSGGEAGPLNSLNVNGATISSSGVVSGVQTGTQQAVVNLSTLVGEVPLVFHGGVFRPINLGTANQFISVNDNGNGLIWTDAAVNPTANTIPVRSSTGTFIDSAITSATSQSTDRDLTPDTTFTGISRSGFGDVFNAGDTSDFLLSIGGGDADTSGLTWNNNDYNVRGNQAAATGFWGNGNSSNQPPTAAPFGSFIIFHVSDTQYGIYTIDSGAGLSNWNLTHVDSMGVIPAIGTSFTIGVVNEFDSSTAVNIAANSTVTGDLTVTGTLTGDGSSLTGIGAGAFYDTGTGGTSSFVWEESNGTVVTAFQADLVYTRAGDTVTVGGTVVFNSGNDTDIYIDFNTLPYAVDTVRRLYFGTWSSNDTVVRESGIISAHGMTADQQDTVDPVFTGSSFRPNTQNQTIRFMFTYITNQGADTENLRDNWVTTA